MDRIDHDINALHELRDEIAAHARNLAERELQARVLRLTIETELQQAGKTKTDADKLAKADQRYLDHETQSIQLTYDRMVLEARAEASRFGIELQLAMLRRESVGV
jgi:hypothetical protein